MARSPGEEIVERRTQRSKTFATAEPDKFKTQLFTGPVHVRNPDTGKWADIATDLVDAAPGRVRNKAGLVKVDLAKNHGVGTLARIEIDDDHSVGFSLQASSSGQGRIAKNRITYSEVRPQVDLELAIHPDGLKEDIVLGSAAAPDRFVFELALEGLKPHLTDGGDVIYTDQTGAQRAVTPRGFMTDATWHPQTMAGARSEAVLYELSQVSGKTLLTVAADEAWLDDPARVYPVRIDPSFFLSTGREDDTTLWFGGGHPPADRAYEHHLNVGSYDGWNYARSYMNFELGQLTYKVIDSATFHIFQNYSNSCEGRTMSLHRVTQAWSGHSMTGPPGASFADWLGSVSMGCDSNWRSWNVTGTVRNWASTAWGQHGLMLRADNEPDGATFRQFQSWNFSGCACDIPHIDIYWTSPPSMATPISPANGANFHTLTPTLSVSASDPEGDQLYYFYRVARYVGPGNGDNAETNVIHDSGWTTSSSLVLPPGALAWNATYTWHVYTHDGVAQTNPDWVWWFAPVNSPPSIASPVAPANGANFHTLTPTLSVSAASDPDGDQVQYYYRVARYVGTGNGDDAETNVVYNSGWTTASSLTLPAGILASSATYTWHVYTQDGIVQTNPDWVWWFTVTAPAGPVQNPRLFPRQGAALIDWDPPASDGGSLITGYQTKTRNLDTGFIADVRVVCSSCTSAIVTGLTDGITYEVHIIGMNAAGLGTARWAGLVIPSPVPRAQCVAEVPPAPPSLQTAEVKKENLADDSAVHVDLADDLNSRLDLESLLPQLKTRYGSRYAGIWFVGESPALLCVGLLSGAISDLSEIKAMAAGPIDRLGIVALKYSSEALSTYRAAAAQVLDRHQDTRFSSYELAIHDPSNKVTINADADDPVVFGEIRSRVPADALSITIDPLVSREMQKHE